MSVYVSDKCETGVPVVTASGPEVIAVRGEYTLAATKPAQNDTIKMVPLPADHVIVDVILDTDDLDGATSITASVGILDDDFDAIVSGTEIITASTICRTGGVARADLASAMRIASSTSNRVVGIKFPAAPGTPTGGTIGLTVLYAAA